MVAARWALPVVLAALRPTRAEEDVGACLVSSAPCDVSRRCGEAEDAFPHSCLATPIPAWRVPFDRIQCCFQCCMVFWLDEFGMRRNNELWMRAHAELHPKDTHTFEHIDRQGLNELPPESVLNVNSRAATLAHYYVEFRGRVSIERPGHERYVPATSAAHVRTHVYPKIAEQFRASPKPVQRKQAGARKPPRAEVPLSSFRPQRRRGTLMFSSPGQFLMDHVHWAVVHLPAPLTVVGGGDGGIRADVVCGGRPDLCDARGCLNRTRVAAAFAQNVAPPTGPPGCPGNVRPLGQGVKHASWLATLAAANASSRAHSSRLLCKYIAGHPGRKEKFDTLRANGFPECSWNFQPGIDAYINAVADARFVAAPRGLGQTCMREWEAVVLGAVPVLERFAPHAGLYGNAPRVEIGDWAEVTPDLLDRRWIELTAAADVTVEHAYFPFWLHEITKGWL